MKNIEKSFVRNLLLLLTIFLQTTVVQAQFDTTHYIPPLYDHETGNHNSGAGIFRLYFSTTVVTPFNIQIKNSSETVLQTLSISASSPATYDMGNEFRIAEAELATVQADEGYIITGPNPFSVSLRVKESSQGGILTSKGTVALGQSFRSGHLNTVNNGTGGDAKKAHIISFMATVDNTTVTVDDIRPGVIFENTATSGSPVTSNPIVVNLDRGESYVLAAFIDNPTATQNVNGVNGTRITSDKDIVMNSGSWSGGAGTGTNRDMGIDQVVPTNLAGVEFILVKGEHTDPRVEAPIVVATADDTDIFLNGSGTPVGNIDAGDYFVINSSNFSVNGNMLVETSQPALLYQTMNGANTGQLRQVGMIFVPPTGCSDSNTAILVDANDIGIADISIIATVGDPVSINGTPISGALAVTGSTTYETYKVQNVTGDQTVTSTGNISVALTNRDGDVGAAGYFTGFASNCGVNAAPTITHGSLPTITVANCAAYPISGTCTADGDNITVSLDDGSNPPISGTATTCGATVSGQFSTTANVCSLNNGSVDVTSTIDDGVNPSVDDTDTVSKDSTAPTITNGSLPSISATNCSAYPVSGTCSADGDSIAVSLDDGTNPPVAATATTCGATVSGQFSTTANVCGLDDGSVDVISTIDDGVNTPVNDTDAVTKDGTPPTITNGSLSTITAANCAAYPVSGTCTADGDSVDVSLDDGVNSPVSGIATTCGATVSGQFSTTVNSCGLNNGSVDVISTIDDGVNTPVSDTDSVSKDSTPPTITNGSLPTISPGNCAAYPISGTCTANGDSITVSLDDGTNPPVAGTPTTCGATISGQFSTTASVCGLDDGSVDVASTIDDGTNPTVSDTDTVSKNGTAPTITHGILPIIIPGNCASYPISGVCSADGNGITVSVDDGSNPPVAGTPTTCGATVSGQFSTTANVCGLDDGSVDITSTINNLVDPAESDTDAVQKDTNPPTITNGSLPSITEANCSAYPVSGTCTEDGDSITVSLDDGTNPPVAATATTCGATVSGQFSTTANVCGLDDGSVDVISTIDDGVNTPVNDTDSVTKDGTGPTITNGSLSTISAGNCSAYPVSGTCTADGDSIAVEVDDGVNTPVAATPTTCGASVSGEFSTTANICGLDDGSVDITSTIDDGVNPPESDTDAVTKDGTPPTIINGTLPAITLGNCAAYPVSGTCTDDGDSVDVSVDDGTNPPVAGVSTFCGDTVSGEFSTTANVCGLDDGSVDVTSTIDDGVNPTVSDTDSVSKDSNGPTITNGSIPDITAANCMTYPVSGTCTEDGDSITVSLDDGTNPPISATATTCGATVSGEFSTTANVCGLDDGPIDITSTIDDGVNPPVPDTDTVDKDSTLPTIIHGSLPNIVSGNCAAYPINGTCTAAGDAITVSLDDGTNPPVAGTPTVCGATTAGQFSSTANVCGLDDGPIDVTSTVDDGVNPTVEDTDTVTKDLVLPTITNGALPPGTSANCGAYPISGTCSADGDAVTVTVDDSSNPVVNATPTTCGATVSGEFSTTANICALDDGNVDVTSTIDDGVNPTASDTDTILLESDNDDDGIPDVDDLDDDNDGVADSIEGTGDADGDGVPNDIDLDSDNDGIPDSIEAGSLDADGNGIIDCSTAPDFSANGFCDDVDPADAGTPVPDPDTDGDGVPNRLDVDSDNDGVPDVREAGGTDANGDGRIDCTVAFDSDGFCDDVDPDDGGTKLPDTNSDSDPVPDRLDLDSDNDGVTDAIESGGTDEDADGTIDSFTDADGDGYDDSLDPNDDTVPGDGDGSGTPYAPIDIDNDSIEDRYDRDSDGDGITDAVEAGGLDADGNGEIDDFFDADGDGYDDSLDPDDNTTPGAGDGSGTPVPDTDSDGDGIPDRSELDSDNDGIPDATEGNDKDNDGQPDTIPTGEDDDGDGIDNAFDPDCTTSSPCTGGTIGEPSDLPDHDQDGIPDYQEPAFELRSPIYIIWNGFLNQLNVAVIFNKSETQSADVTLTLLGIDGDAFSSKVVTLPPRGERNVLVNLLDGFTKDSYGLLKIEFTPDKIVDGYSALYRVSKTSDDIEFALHKEYANAITGNSYIGANTIQPSKAPGEQMNGVRNWLQIANHNLTATKRFTVNRYDSSGNLFASKRVKIPALGRRDVPVGHTDSSPPLSRPTEVSLVEVIPDNADSAYSGELFRYGGDSVIGVAPLTNSFGLSGNLANGNVFTKTLFVSSGAEGEGVLELYNLSDKNNTIDVQLRTNSGELVDTVSVKIKPKGQYHLSVSGSFPNGKSGVAITSSQNDRSFIVRHTVYFRKANGSVSTAYTNSGRFPLTLRGFTVRNTFLNQQNWLKLFNLDSVSRTATVEAYNQEGVLLGSAVVTLGAKKGKDLELNGSLGLGLPVDSFGQIKVIPSAEKAIVGELLKFKPSSVGSYVDLAKPLPVR